MSRLMNAYRLFLQGLRQKTTVKFVGEDLSGNKYYEEHRTEGDRKVRRFYKNHEFEDADPWKAELGAPPLWDAWLRFKRMEPPSREEMVQAEQYFQKQQAMANEKKEDQLAKPSDPKVDLNPEKKAEFPKLPLGGTPSE